MKPARVGQKNYGLTIIEVMVVLAILAIVAALVLPAIPHPDRSALTGCMYNLKQIGLANALWNMDHHKNGYPAQDSTNQLGTMEYLQSGRVDLHFRALATYIGSQPQVLRCPADRRKLADDFAVLNNTNISYFVSLDAAPTNVVPVAAGGDCNLEIDGRVVHSSVATWTATNTIEWTQGRHSGAGDPIGNFLFSDGHVEHCLKAVLPIVTQRLGTNANRLAFP